MTSKTFARFGLAAAAAATSLLAAAPPALAQGKVQAASGHGTLLVESDTGLVRRQFSFSASRKADGKVSGNATLVNRSFTGENGHSPYQLQIDITCFRVVGNIGIFGGTTKRTNDPNLVDAVFFTVQDNGEPGAGKDRISRAYFWDDDPGTTGNPQACQDTGPFDFPLEAIEAGNVQVKS